MRQHRSIELAAALVAIFGFAAVPLSARSSECPVNDNGHRTTVNRLFKDIDQQSYNLQDHAATMRTVSNTEQLDFQFYVDQLNTVKNDVNEIGREYPSLLNQACETPSEHQVIARMHPQLEAIASTVDSAIQFVNGHQDELQLPQFTNLTNQLSNETLSMWHMIHDAIRLNNLHTAAHQTRQALTRAEARG